MRYASENNIAVKQILSPRDDFSRGGFGDVRDKSFGYQIKFEKADSKLQELQIQNPEVVMDCRQIFCWTIGATGNQSSCLARGNQ